jgi:hypothetical protein
MPAIVLLNPEDAPGWMVATPKTPAEEKEKEFWSARAFVIDMGKNKNK